MNEERIAGLKHVRSEVPLSDGDFAAIRRAVLQEMARGRVASPAGRLLRQAFESLTPVRIAAAIGIALIALASFVALREPSLPPEHPASTTLEQVTATPVSEKPVAATPSMTATATTHAPAGTAAPQLAQSVERPSGRSAVRAQRSEPTTVAPAFARIELETSDPDVRIIWIQSQTSEETSR